jgi:hypothetical protein
MIDFVERVVLRMRQDPEFSRNRHFAALSSSEGRRAVRIHRHLRSIERDLSRGWVGTVDHEAERIRLSLRSHQGRRIAYLTAGEFRILCSDPDVRATLGI